MIGPRPDSFLKPATDSAGDIFKRILHDAHTDPNIIGFWLGGSRGKGLITEYSDYDCTMLVRDEVLAEYKKRYEHQKDPNVELRVTTLDEFKTYAAWGSDESWDRYDFAHLKPLVDKTGHLQELFQEKASIPDAVRKKFVGGHLDGYINEVYRSLKCLRDGQTVGRRLQAAQSVALMLKVLFGMHGRVQPFSKYLEWELKTFPLEKLTLSPDELIASILKIVETGSVPTQQEILAHMEAMARADGHGHVFDGWGSRLSWIKEFKPK